MHDRTRSEPVEVALPEPDGVACDVADHVGSEYLTNGVADGFAYYVTDEVLERFTVVVADGESNERPKH
jgi:hypothetical protein